MLARKALYARVQNSCSGTLAYNVYCIAIFLGATIGEFDQRVSDRGSTRKYPSPLRFQFKKCAPLFWPKDSPFGSNPAEYLWLSAETPIRRSQSRYYESRRRSLISN